MFPLVGESLRVELHGIGEVLRITMDGHHWYIQAFAFLHLKVERDTYLTCFVELIGMLNQ